MVDMAVIRALLTAILGVVLLVGIFLVLNEITEYQFAHAQTNQTVIPKPQISPPNITPTAPNPNFQYLPQKAFVYSFAPENGVPNPMQLQQLPAAPYQPVLPTQVVAPQPAAVGGLGAIDIAGIAGIVAGGIAFLKGHLAQKNANKNEVLVKENMFATVKSKDQIGEIARLLYEWNAEKANALDGTAPAVKLETLKDDKEDFEEKAAKA